MNKIIPPHNLEAENCLLACCLIRSSTYSKVRSIVSNSSAFYEIRNSTIWEAIGRVGAQGESIDAYSVLNELQKDGKNEFLGYDGYLLDLRRNFIATATHAESYARIVREFWIRREVILLATELRTDAFDLGKHDSITDAISIHLARMSNAEAFSTAEVATDIQAYYPTVLAEYDDAKNLPLSSRSLGLGYFELDNLYDGLKPGNLVIIVAPSGMGKSDFMMNCALNIAKDAPVTIFSIEMTKKALTTRMMAIVNNTNSRLIRRGEGEFTPAFNRDGFGNGRIFIDGNRNVSAFDIRSKLVTMTAKNGVKVAFIDHKEKLRFHTKYRSDVDNWRAIPQELQNIAADLGIVIVLLAQPTLEGLRKGKISGSDIRNGGFEDADIVMSLYRPNYQKEYLPSEPLDVIVWKAREGSPGSIQLNYQSHSGLMTQYEGLKATGLPAAETPKPEPFQEESPF